MGYQFEIFDVVLKKRGRAWKWSVITAEGTLVMQGSEANRPTARYVANRSLFLLLLSSPYQRKRRTNPRGAAQDIPDQLPDNPWSS